MWEELGVEFGVSFVGSGGVGVGAAGFWGGLLGSQWYRCLSGCVWRLVFVK